MKNILTFFSQLLKRNSGIWLRFRLSLGLGLGLAMAWPGLALAQEGGPAAGSGADLPGLFGAALLLLFPLGLMLLLSSAMPEEQAPVTAVQLGLAWAAAGLAYFGVGFAFHFGGIAQVSPRPDLSGLYWEWYPLDQSISFDVARLWGLVALRGWALSGEAATPGAFRLFLSHLSLVGVAAMIPVCALPRLIRGGLAILVGLLVGTFLYPLPGNWVWGGGWLASLGASLGLGHGLVDFGGAGVIFLSSSLVALTALIVFKSFQPEDDRAQSMEVVVSSGLDSRLTVYEESPETAPEVLPTTPMPSAYLPLLSLLGAGLMLAGWLGVAWGGHTPTALNFSPAQAGLNGLLAALSAALTTAGYSWFTTRTVNPLMMTRGLVAGLVLAVAGAPFIPPWLLILAGLGLGLVLPALIYLFNQGLNLNDESGVVATYGVSALLSLGLVAFFANGQAGQGWNGVGLTGYRGVDGQGVSGLFVAPGLAADWPGQFQAQLLGTGAIILWSLALSFLLFYLIKAAVRAWAESRLELAGAAYPEPEPATDEDQAGHGDAPPTMTDS